MKNIRSAMLQGLDLTRIDERLYLHERLADYRSFDGQRVRACKIGAL